MIEERHAHAQSDSFLVRRWVESREVADHPGVLRVYVRNLRTGEEHYLSSAEELVQLLGRGLRAEGESADGSPELKSDVG